MWSQGELMDNGSVIHNFVIDTSRQEFCFFLLKCMIRVSCDVQGQNRMVGTGRHVFQMEMLQSYLLKNTYKPSFN